jgi:hypothetical protein
VDDYYPKITAWLDITGVWTRKKWGAKQFLRHDPSDLRRLR